MKISKLYVGYWAGILQACGVILLLDIVSWWVAVLLPGILFGFLLVAINLVKIKVLTDD